MNHALILGLLAVVWAQSLVYGGPYGCEKTTVSDFPLAFTSPDQKCPVYDFTLVFDEFKQLNVTIADMSPECQVDIPFAIQLGNCKAIEGTRVNRGGKHYLALVVDKNETLTLPFLNNSANLVLEQNELIIQNFTGNDTSDIRTPFVCGVPISHLDGFDTIPITFDFGNNETSNSCELEFVLGDDARLFNTNGSIPEKKKKEDDSSFMNDPIFCYAAVILSQLTGLFLGLTVVFFIFYFLMKRSDSSVAAEETEAKKSEKAKKKDEEKSVKQSKKEIIKKEDSKKEKKTKVAEKESETNLASVTDKDSKKDKKKEVQSDKGKDKKSDKSKDKKKDPKDKKSSKKAKATKSKTKTSKATKSSSSSSSETGNPSTAPGATKSNYQTVDSKFDKL